VERARRSARVTRRFLVVASLVVFMIASMGAKLQQSSHRREKPRTLHAPGTFLAIVTKDALDAGMLAPTEAEPTAESRSS
jgi:hypothetical protein